MTLGPVPIKVDQNIARMAAEAWKALRAASNESVYFRWGGGLVELQSEGAQARLAHLDPMTLRARLRRIAKWKARTSKRLVDVPLEVARDMVAQPDPTLPRIARVVRAPVFLPDGTLLTEHGYSPANETLSLIPNQLAGIQVPMSPTADEVQSARALILDELLADFSFASATHRANAVAMMLLPLVRPMIHGPTPLHLITKPVHGSGGTLLAEVCLLPVSEGPVSMASAPNGAEEMRKCITAALLDQPAYVIFDNVDDRFSSSSLAAALTTLQWNDRRMGVSERISVPVSCTWVATGNNPRLTPELSRRVVFIRLDPCCDRPWERSGWKHPLPGWAIENRPAILRALLTLVRAYICAGCPVPHSDVRLGRFEDYARVLGGILDQVGIPGFLMDQHEYRTHHDEESEGFKALVEAWWSHFQDAHVDAKRLLPIAETIDALDLGPNHGTRSRVLGKMLSKHRDQLCGDYRLTSLGTYQGSHRYRLQRAPLPLSADVSAERGAGVEPRRPGLP